MLDLSSGESEGEEETEGFAEKSVMEVENDGWTTFTRSQLSEWSLKWLKPFEEVAGLRLETLARAKEGGGINYHSRK